MKQHEWDSRHNQQDSALTDYILCYIKRKKRIVELAEASQIISSLLHPFGLISPWEKFLKDFTGGGALNVFPKGLQDEVIFDFLYMLHGLLPLVAVLFLLFFKKIFSG